MNYDQITHEYSQYLILNLGNSYLTESKYTKKGLNLKMLTSYKILNNTQCKYILNSYTFTKLLELKFPCLHWEHEMYSSECQINSSPWNSEKICSNSEGLLNNLTEATGSGTVRP